MGFLSSRMKRGELFDYLTERVTLSEKETRSGPVQFLCGRVPKGKDNVSEMLSVLCVLLLGRSCALWWRWCSSSTARTSSIGTWSPRTSSWTTRWTSNWPTSASPCRSRHTRCSKVCDWGTAKRPVSPVLLTKCKQVMWSHARWHTAEARAWLFSPVHLRLLR